MPSLDYNYIADLVVRAQSDDTDAFAELYAATYQKQYNFAYSYLNDAYLAQDALQETYTIALKDLSKLKDPLLLVAWLNQINFRVCFHMRKRQKIYSEEIAGYEDLNTMPASPPPGLRFCIRTFRSRRRSGGFRYPDRFEELYHEADFELTLYGIAGYPAAVFQKSEI